MGILKPLLFRRVSGWVGCVFDSLLALLVLSRQDVTDDQTATIQTPAQVVGMDNARYYRDHLAVDSYRTTEAKYV